MPLPRRQKSEPTPSSKAPTPMPRRPSVRARLPGEALDYTVWKQEALALASTMEACERSNATPLLPRRQISAEKCHEDVADLDKLVQRVAARSGCPELVAVARQHSGARARATVERQGSASAQKASASGLEHTATALPQASVVTSRREPGVSLRLPAFPGKRTRATDVPAGWPPPPAAPRRDDQQQQQNQQQPRLAIVSIAFKAGGAISP